MNKLLLQNKGLPYFYYSISSSLEILKQITQLLFRHKNVYDITH